MSFQIIPQQQSSFGKLLTGASKGFAEQAPKETEHYRLSKGLKELGQKTNLSPLEFATEASSIYGMRPEMVNQFGKLARLQAQGHALTNRGNVQEEKGSILQDYLPQSERGNSEIPSITTSSPVEATIDSYVAPTDRQIMEDAAIKFDKNPALYQNDPNLAVEHARRDAEQERLRNQDLISRRDKQNLVQDKIQKELKDQADKLGVEIPPDIYSKIEDEAINAVIPKKDGGRGLTEQQARKEYGKKVDDISRNYRDLKTIASSSFINNSGSDVKKELESIRHNFKKNDDLENYALKLISEAKLSPIKAFQRAYPVSDFKDLQEAFKKLPKITQTTSEDAVYETKNIAPHLASLMGQNASPLSIAQELEDRGYSGRDFIDYVKKNRNSLDLTERQGRQLSQPLKWLPTPTDLWFDYFSGKDPLKEIE